MSLTVCKYQNCTGGHKSAVCYCSWRRDFSGHTLHIQTNGFFMCATNYPFSHILVVISLVQSSKERCKMCKVYSQVYNCCTSMNITYMVEAVVCLTWTFIAVWKLLESKKLQFASCMSTWGLLYISNIHEYLEYLRVIVYKETCCTWRLPHWLWLINLPTKVTKAKMQYSYM